ncbi:CoA-binding protein [Polaribacter sp. HL-MS24]|uniref:CoA-binding protein n=1 Tax=Polaribacter sp. HL-MS24 TaxID=3077735 RepID=UPI002934A63E|nr:CoA-binding protein [Polaribacter sp. HL-MS24]WOC39697.1 CoA-binding protein [Polaribacter sp. HL-MS24]
MKKATLVLGASLKEDRYSNIVIHRLKEKNQNVFAFGMQEGTIAGVPVDVQLKKYSNIDTVTLYLNPMRQEALYGYIIDLQPRRVIFNPGTENDVFAKLLQEKGIECEVACTLVLLATQQY